jgi:hypothetical protein
MSRLGIPEGALAFLDRRSAVQFVAILYAARWVALAPVMVVSHFLLTEGQKQASGMPEEWSQGNPLGLFIGLVLVPPVLETLLECSLPYWVFSKVRGYRHHRPRRCWGFIVTSASIMVLLHPMLEAILPSFITGAFLAYCYAHFAPAGVGKAILATSMFHAAVNLVGWTMLVWAGM